MVPQIVVFDLGKVLVDFDYGIAARRIAARGHMPAGEVEAFMCRSWLLVGYETGEIDQKEFFAQVRAATGFSGTLEEFAGYFADIFTPIETMIDVHRQLHARGIPTYILSNTNDLAIAHIRRNFPFFSHFNGYAFSYEHGAMKPSPKLYEVVEKMAGAAGERILFLDDREENTAAGTARGWQTIHHQSAQETIRILKQMSLLSEEEPT